MKKIIVRTLIVLSVLVSLVFFGYLVTNLKNTKGKAGKVQDIIIGFSQIGAESAWRTCNTESMRTAAEQAGIKLIYANAEQKQENQIKAIRSFIVYQVDVIVFVPIVKDGWDNVLKEAKDAGIPVLVVDRQIETKDKNLYAGFIGNDSFQEGILAANFVLQKFKNTKRNIQILEIQGTEGSSAAEGRYHGFRHVLDQDKRFSIVYSESGDFLRSRGKEIAERYFSSNSKDSIDVIYSHNDGMTLGAIDALIEKNIKPGKDIVIVSIDAEQAAIDGLRKGYLNCVIECDPKLGPMIMDVVKQLVNDNLIEKNISTSRNIVFTEYDDLSNIAERGY